MQRVNAGLVDSPTAWQKLVWTAAAKRERTVPWLTAADRACWEVAPPLWEVQCSSKLPRWVAEAVECCGEAPCPLTLSLQSDMLFW